MTTIINYLTRIRFGRGEVGHIDEELRSLGVSRPLLVTDKGLMESGVFQSFMKTSQLPSDTPVFQDTPANPTESAVGSALALLQKHDCDSLIAVGGGSSIDLAKGVALLATHAPPLRQYAVIEGGAGKIQPDVLPLIAVPTTAGTGSEVGRASLISMRDEHKLGFISPYLIPSVAVCDPDMTASLPRYLTAATGMDAIAHCVETFLSPRVNPPADAIAMDGLKRAIQNIEDAAGENPSMEARNEMMMAALEGALAFQKGLGAVHSLSHALGGFHELKLHHGTLNAILMPAVLRFNQPHCETKFATLREVMGLSVDADVSAFFAELNARLGLPGRLGDIGVTREIFDKTADWACKDHSTPTNPRPVTKADFLEILAEAL
ncbi:iron-containing alcohol dehydrogenase [Halomonas sp. TRM85114]|uniref:iron-containing alcohol dehydrogenase n=1 Tax=Halomonas jincaotanensis TaxID=2810616 RepID=UPI001BD4612E|nr:iron-containing alcohol dehydrogenase [Halomonas jincaotanensis]MBS9402354.1 iron-containing alcohol dehydrogenase [Halomonas jincaotanensis]